MSAFRLIWLSLVYHRAVHAAVACGVAAGTAVLTGALLVGDSMRFSLRHLTLERLGRIDQAMLCDRFFRARLADELAAHPEFPPHAAAVPVILLQVSLATDEGESPRKANRVNLIGCDGRFWQLGSGGSQRPPEARQIVLTQPLAEQLGVQVGASVVVRLPRPGPIPAESPLGRKSETVRTVRLQVSAILPAEGLGRFGLRPDQRLPRNAYCALEELQANLDQPGRVNAILVADADQSVQPLVQPTPEDDGIRIQQSARGYLQITSDRMLLEPGVEETVVRALGPASYQRAFTYLANTIACGDREIPYSTITAVDFTDRVPLGPMLAPDGTPIGPLAEDQIVLNTWAARELQAKPGDRIRVTYFQPDSPHGLPRERTADFRLKAIVDLVGAAADPDFTPEVPGVTDRLSITSWDPPFPFDARRIRPQDEAYWKAHRATPKAFVSLATGQRLWGSRFGRVTSVRVSATDPATVQQIRQIWARNPAAMGFVFQPVKQQGLAASAGTTPFELLFLGFSSFLIAAAVMLVALLFRLGVDRRAEQIGILLALGFRRGQVAGFLALEGLVVAAIGSLLGLALGVAYAALMILGLHTWWLPAIGTPFLKLHGTWNSVAIGYASGLAVAWAAIAYSARSAARTHPQRLLMGQIGPETARVSARPQWVRRAAWGLIALAVATALAGAAVNQQVQAITFFAAGALGWTGLLLGVWARLVSGATGPAVALGRGNLARLAVRNAARHPTRSVLTIGLVGSASFLIVALSAFRLDPARLRHDRSSPSGGFAWVAESDQPIHFDLNTAEGRAQLGFSEEDSRLVARTNTVALRVRPGENASCLNLYRPQQPRVLGVPKPLIRRGGFVWAGTLSPGAIDALRPVRRPLPGDDEAVQRPDRPGDAIRDASANPWGLLELELAPDPDGVPRLPAVLEKNTALYSLHLGKGLGRTYEIRDGSGRPIRLVIVGLLGPSLFQGDILVSEQAFVQHFPDETGYRFFLIEPVPSEAAPHGVAPLAPAETLASNLPQVLERTLGDFGLSIETAAERLAAFQTVQNTYLSTFQSLGGLGLLLGTFGLAAVQLRSVLERRSELALLQAVGFRRRLLAQMIALENAFLLGAGLACGVLAAAVAVLPHFATQTAIIPVAWLAGTLGLVLAVGLLAGLVAVYAAVRTPPVASLRRD